MSSWWANKLGTQPSQSTAPAQYPPTTAINHAPAPYPQPYQQPGQNQPAGPPPATVDEALKRGFTSKETIKAGETHSCPNCGSNNYFVRLGSVHTMNGPVSAGRCFDCGWPLIQAGSGK